MKKLLFTLFVLLAGTLFAGCASLPEPSGSDSIMIYGSARYQGLFVFGGNTSKAVSTVKIDGITVNIKNIDDGLTFSATTNKEGELFFKDVTPGTYLVKYIGTEYRYDGKTWQLRYNVPAEVSQKFTVRSGVTNIGKIVVNLDTDSGEDYVTWAKDIEKVQNTFKTLHPNSKWNDISWSNANE